jgi:acyl-coenzyme A synthetase/AMP-(fatty) acid ligase
LPKDIEVWDTRQIPYTENGKIRKLEMRKRYERRKLNEKA